VSERSARVLLTALSVAGLLMSAYLTWVHFLGVSPVCLAGSGGCEAVQTSRYAEILGVPVAVLGIAGYTGLLFSALLRGESGVLLGLFVALVSVLFSAYLTWLELFVIHAICQWCVASAILMMASFLLTVIRVRHWLVRQSKS
jgi:uncharacterized membrane protein